MDSADHAYQNDDSNTDEGGMEVEWLRAVGLDTAVEQFEKGNIIEDATVKQQLSFLTRQQRVTVEKRLTLLNKRTLRRRKRTVRSDIDGLQGVLAESNSSRYVIEAPTSRDIQPPNERTPYNALRGSMFEHLEERVVVSPSGRRSEPFLGHQMSDSSVSRSSHQTTPNVSASNLPYAPNSCSLRQQYYYPHATNGHRDPNEECFEEDFFELIDADVDDDFVEEEDMTDSPDFSHLPDASGIPLTLPEPISMNSISSADEDSDAVLSRRSSSILGSKSGSPGHEFASRQGSSGETSGSEYPSGSDAVDRPVRSYRLWSIGSMPKVVVSSKVRKNGRSTLYDLSQADVNKLNSLSLLQLTSVFDQHDIPFSIPKKTPKVSSKHHPAIFGRSVSSLVEEERRVNHHQGQYVLCPRFILELLRHLLRPQALREDGILRKNGNQARVKAYRLEIDQTFNHRQFDWDSVTNYDAASLLKQFLQELPVPLLTFEYMALFPLVCKMNCKVGKKLEALNLLILMLPCSHSHTLKLLLVYLFQVAQNEQYNQMNLESVAKIMTPNFFAAVSDKGGKSYKCSLGSMDDEMRSNQEQQEVMQLLINYHEQLWIVPDFLLSEIRLKYQNHGLGDRQKALPVLKSLFKRAPRRESTDLVDGGHTTNAVNLIASTAAAVTAFVPRKVDIKLGHDSIVQVDTQLYPTVGDIMEYIQKTTMPTHKCPSSTPVAPGSPVGNRGDSGNSQVTESPGSNGSSRYASSYSQEGWMKAIDGDISKKLCLFEVGGNISKRCLSDEKALFSNLFALNPSASWVVEFR